MAQYGGDCEYADANAMGCEMIHMQPGSCPIER
jgi:hypothetical protein